MNAIDDGPLQDTPELGSDLSTYFELVWRHLDAREKRAGNDNSARHKVRLECSGDLIDAESIGVVVTRGPEAGGKSSSSFSVRNAIDFTNRRGFAELQGAPAV